MEEPVINRPTPITPENRWLLAPSKELRVGKLFVWRKLAGNGALI